MVERLWLENGLARGAAGHRLRLRHRSDDCPVKAGVTFTRENLWVKRPATDSIHATILDEVLGKTAARDIAADRHVTHENIVGFA